MDKIMRLIKLAESVVGENLTWNGDELNIVIFL